MMEFAQATAGCAGSIVINKIDARRAPTEQVLAEIRETFGRECLPLNLPAERRHAGRRLLLQARRASRGLLLGRGRTPRSSTRSSKSTKQLMALYLEQGEELTPEQLHDPFEQALREGHLVPVCFVSARNRRRRRGAARSVRAADAESAGRQSAALPQGRGRRARSACR